MPGEYGQAVEIAREEGLARFAERQPEGLVH